ncbi:hypothetical protein D3C87_1376650 [compost metagenome]
MIVIRCGTGGLFGSGQIVFGCLEQQRVDRSAIQLLAPGTAAILAVQHHTVVAHGPAILPIDELHGGQQQVDRHLGLSHLAAGIAQQNMTGRADHHLLLTDWLDVAQQCLRPQCGRLRRALQAIVQRCSIYSRSAQAKQQGECGM